MPLQEKRKRHRDKDSEKTALEDGGKDWREMSTSQRKPKIASNHQQIGEKHGRDSLSERPEGPTPVNTWSQTSSLLQKCKRINFYCLGHLVVVICYDSPGKLVHLFTRALLQSLTELYQDSCFIFSQPIKTYLSWVYPSRSWPLPPESRWGNWVSLLGLYS